MLESVEEVVTAVVNYHRLVPNAGVLCTLTA